MKVHGSVLGFVYQSCYVLYDTLHTKMLHLFYFTQHCLHRYIHRPLRRLFPVHELRQDRLSFAQPSQNLQSAQIEVVVNTLRLVL